MEEDIHVNDDAPIVIIAGGREANGSVVSTANKAIIISLYDDFGERISIPSVLGL